MRLVASVLLLTTVLAQQAGDLRTSVRSFVDSHQKEIVGELFDSIVTIAAILRM